MQRERNEMDNRDETMGQWDTIRGDEGASWQAAPDATFGDLPTLRDEGVVLAGRYKVVKRLGEGGMGSVWLAEDSKLDGRKVAIKMLPAILAGKKGAYRQVKAEALMAMKLSHSNIATVRSFEEDEGGNPFLVMDYIEGEPLDDILAERGPLGEEETVRLLGPVAAALDYAHSQGVVHRDVKPGNVMVRKDGTPFVLDFGIAREVQETMTMVTGKMSSGTLLYMSPEQLRGKGPTAAQDVYSFAAMAYECLAGHPPFYRGAIEDQIKNESPEELPGSVGEGLRGGVMAGLAKEPEKRPGTCAGVLGGSGSEGGASRPGEPKKGTEDSSNSGSAGTPRPTILVQRELELERKAREEAEKTAREAHREAQQRTREAMEAEAARGRAVGWSVFFVIAMVVGGIGTYVWWQGKEEEQKLEMGKLRQQVEAAKAAQPATPQRTPVAQPAPESAVPATPAKAARGVGEGAYEGEERDFDLGNGAKIRMVWCPAGSFTMGSPIGEEGRFGDERQHRVTLAKGFWMAKYEVTQEQWKSVMGNNPSSFKGDDLPVENVSWDDCQKFCNKTGLRSPTGEEWEYACRAGSQTAFFWGDALNGDKANCNGNHPCGTTAKGPYKEKTTPVGSYAPNAWGLYDMHGNVSEWCQDEYLPKVEPEPAPYVRGGSWDSDARDCRSACFGWSPYPDGYRLDLVGFRPVCSAELFE